jgi:hypothetical protein
LIKARKLAAEGEAGIKRRRELEVRKREEEIRRKVEDARTKLEAELRRQFEREYNDKLETIKRELENEFASKFELEYKERESEMNKRLEQKVREADDMKKLLIKLDILLENLPDEVIWKFAESEDFKLYERVITMCKSTK